MNTTGFLIFVNFFSIFIFKEKLQRYTESSHSDENVLELNGSNCCKAF